MVFQFRNVPNLLLALIVFFVHSETACGTQPPNEPFKCIDGTIYNNVSRFQETERKDKICFVQSCTYYHEEENNTEAVLDCGELDQKKDRDRLGANCITYHKDDFKWCFTCICETYLCNKYAIDWQTFIITTTPTTKTLPSTDKIPKGYESFDQHTGIILSFCITLLLSI